jgi:hypothetical protein
VSDSLALEGGCVVLMLYVDSEKGTASSSASASASATKRSGVLGRRVGFGVLVH